MEKPNKQEGESLFNFAHPPVAEDAVVSQGGQMNLADESDNSMIMKIFQKIQSTLIDRDHFLFIEEDWLYNKEILSPPEIKKATEFNLSSRLTIIIARMKWNPCWNWR